MLTSEKIKKLAMEYGADAVGIAPMSRFEGALRNWTPDISTRKRKA